jgi:hypothetical protein
MADSTRTFPLEDIRIDPGGEHEYSLREFAQYEIQRGSKHQQEEHGLRNG